MEYKMGDIIKVEVVGSQPYGLFVKSVDDNTITGLIHISRNILWLCKRCKSSGKNW